jgi:hypothetical protein
MKSIVCVVAVMLAGVAGAALQDGDFLVLNDNGELEPTPETSSIFIVKPDGTVETLKTFGPWEYISGIAVHPDGSIIAARDGNYPGGPTPTQVPVGPGTPTPTPYPPNFWRESAIYKLQPDGSAGILAQGGILNPASAWNNSIVRAACDALGNTFVINWDYQGPPEQEALLKIAPDGAVSVFSSGGLLLQQPTDNALAVSADNEVFMAQVIWPGPPFTGPGTPTPVPARIIKADTAGALSVSATAASRGGSPMPSPPFPPNMMLWWSEPFEFVWGLDFDFQGRLLVSGAYIDDPWAFILPLPGGRHMGIYALNPDGTFTTVVDGNANGYFAGQEGFCFDGQGTLVGAADTAVYRFEDGGQISFIHSGPPFVWIDDLKFYPPAIPPFETWFSESMLARGEGVAVGFDIARGRTNNTADLYFGIRYPSFAGGAIQLLNPNTAANGFPLLIPLDLARQYPSQVGKLRYGNGTTTIRGGGSVELQAFPSVGGIPAGTYQFLGVMTEPGANLFDTSKWRTPNGQPVSAECVYIGTL